MPPSNFEEEYELGAASSLPLVHKAVSMVDVTPSLYLWQMTPRASRRHTLQHSPTSFPRSSQHSEGSRQWCKKCSEWEMVLQVQHRTGSPEAGAVHPPDTQQWMCPFKFWLWSRWWSFGSNQSNNSHWPNYVMNSSLQIFSHPFSAKPFNTEFMVGVLIIHPLKMKFLRVLQVNK